MQSKFKEGDVVKLKSGGPDMTISKVVINQVSKQYNDIIQCTWFDGTQQNSGSFRVDMLELVNTKTS